MTNCRNIDSMLMCRKASDFDVTSIALRDMDSKHTRAQLLLSKLSASRTKNSANNYSLKVNIRNNKKGVKYAQNNNKNTRTLAQSQPVLELLFLNVNNRSRFCRQRLALSSGSTFSLHIRLTFYGSKSKDTKRSETCSKLVLKTPDQRH